MYHQYVFLQRKGFESETRTRHFPELSILFRSPTGKVKLDNEFHGNNNLSQSMQHLYITCVLEQRP